MQQIYWRLFEELFEEKSVMEMESRDVFRTQSNNYNGAFLRKKLMDKSS